MTTTTTVTYSNTVTLVYDTDTGLWTVTKIESPIDIRVGDEVNYDKLMDLNVLSGSL